jgi:hypothetical protein
MKIALTLGILALILLGIGFVCIHDFTSTPTSTRPIPTACATVVIVYITGMDESCVGQNLKTAALKRGVNLRVLSVLRSPFPDRDAVLVELPPDCDVVSVFGQLILIDFVKEVFNDEHHAAKSKDSVILK